MKKTILQNLTLALFIKVLASAAISLGSEGLPPIADAGLPRYAAQDPVVLDGMGSYNPDDSGALSYTWRQISGPPVMIADANTAAPTVSGFVQTDAIQECEFELVVSDGELTSLPDSVRVVIVSDFGANVLTLQNDSFDPNKPTLIFFGGGDCITGTGSVGHMSWVERANVISFPNYEPDPNYLPGIVDSPRTYYRCGDMIIVYLSSVAPDYQQPIQTSGWSTGGQPAVDVGIHLNLTYADARYAINRVTLIDARACRDHSDSIRQFLGSSVDGEQCWIDNYRGNTDGPYPSWPSFYPNVLRVGSSLSHVGVVMWYGNSLTGSDMNQFNHGVVGGAYWSVMGPGKNLQLASTPGVATYSFTWYGGESSGYMGFYDEPNHPGRLPEPVTLIGPPDGAVVDANGVVLSCEVSENAIGYQLLFGSEPYRVMDYMIVSDTPVPPSEVITSFPYEQTWWTIQVYDAFGSTIYADPVCVYPEKVEAPEPGLIANWKLDETEGDIAYDSAGNNHGTLNGDPQWVSGLIDGALEFDGQADYVEIGDLDLTGSFTLTCWMRPSSLPGGWHTVVIKEFDYGFEFDGTIFWGEVGRGAYSWGEVSTTISTPAIWYHAALTWNGSDVEMFIDGSSVGQDTGGTHVSNNKPLLFGSWDTSSEFFNGIIDDVRIYDVALTAEEIAVLAQ